MEIKLYRTAFAEFDAIELARMVDASQFFFTLKLQDEEIAFPPELSTGALIEAEAFVAHFLTLTGPASLSPSIILTSARLAASNGSTGVTKFHEVAILSNHVSERKGVNALLHAVRQLLHIGMAFLVSHESEVDSCVCANVGFDCLCFTCEAKLRARGFRDGIRRLKETFNWLNQRNWSDQVRELAAPGSSIHSSELALARSYVDELVSEGYTLERTVVVLVLHFLSDLIPFVNALEGLGARSSAIFLVAKPYPYSRRDEVAQVLQSKGVAVFRSSRTKRVEDCAREVLTTLLSRQGDSRPLLVIEDGGYFAPILHEPKFAPLLARCVGVVEQTQKGIKEDKKLITDPAVPILSVAESDFKKQYESPEIGRVAIQNIARFTGNTKLSGRNAVIFGFGSVGQEVAFHLSNAFNMTVSVVDPIPLALCRAIHRRTVVSEAAAQFSMLQFKSRVVLVVGTTGTQSITKAILQELPDGAILVSTSSDQVEIDVEGLHRLSAGRVVVLEEGKEIHTIGEKGSERCVTLLAEGYPINFYAAESVPNDTIDPIMTLLLLCGMELTRGQTWKNGINTKAVNEVVTKRLLVERFLKVA